MSRTTPTQQTVRSGAHTRHTLIILCLLLLAAASLAVLLSSRDADAYAPRVSLPPGRHLGECGSVTFYWQSWLPPSPDSLSLSPASGLAWGQPQRRPAALRLWRISLPFWAETLHPEAATLYCQQTPVANLPAFDLQRREALPFPRLTPAARPSLPPWETLLLAIAWLCVLTDLCRLLRSGTRRTQGRGRDALPRTMSVEKLNHTLESLLPPPGEETPTVAEARRYARRLLFDRDARTPEVLACAMSLREASVRSRWGRTRQ